MKNIKRIYTKIQSRTLSRKNTYTSINNKNNNNINQNDSFHSNVSYLSKNLLNKLELINKEVEKYEQNYERLKNETKRRNKNVIRILSSNYFEFKKYQNFKYNNSCQNDKKITFFDNNDLENEKERNLKLELNSFNYKIRNSKQNEHFFRNK